MESHVPWAAPLLRPRGRGHLCHSRWPSLSLTLCPQFLGVQPRDLRQHQDGASYHRPGALLGALLARPHGDLRTSGRAGWPRTLPFVTQRPQPPPGARRRGRPGFSRWSSNSSALTAHSSSAFSADDLCLCPVFLTQQ